MRTIAFVTVNYNNSLYTDRLCASLAAQRGSGVSHAIQCSVVDNSTDSAAATACAQLAARYEWVRYIRSEQNLGYFGGLNRGLAERPQAGAEFVVICNNDLEFAPDFCEQLGVVGAAPNVLALCPDVETSDGMHQNPHVAVPISWFRRLQFDVLFSNYYVACVAHPFRRLFSDARRAARRHFVPQRLEIHMGIGACYVLTRHFFARFEKLYYPAFLYGEEAFISAQIHGVGGKLVYEPGLHVRHAESASTASMPPRAKYEFGRAAYRLYRDLL
jgi:GT2 family glycosyltransferase